MIDETPVLDYREAARAIAAALHEVPSLSSVSVYDERQKSVPKLPAVFIDPIIVTQTYGVDGRRVFERTVQIMVSFDPDSAKAESMDALGVTLMAVLEYIPWNGLRLHTWNRSWSISGSDLVVSLTFRHHHLITKE